jgi:lipoyl(octanoyl) transferase
VRWLGRVHYAEALALQERLVQARREGAAPDTLLLLEHFPVVTLGRSADPAHVRLAPEALARRGIEIQACGRGGDVTYHGPGQLVGYPILALHGARRDAHRYLRDLEQALLDTVAAYGLRATRLPGATGIWAGEDKLAAIGVRLNAGWITSHGFALNVGSDLAGFATIVPCGIADRGVTSMSRLLGRELDPEQVSGSAAACLAAVFERDPVPLALAGTAALSSTDGGVL